MFSIVVVVVVYFYELQLYTHVSSPVAMSVKVIFVSSAFPSK
jgi:hypothetical protein